MQQVVLAEPGRLELREVTRPAARPGEALVRIHRVGICGTDFHAFAGRQPYFVYPRVLGHELAGVVEAVADEEGRVRTGDACAIRPFVNNPDSRASRRGRSNCCEDLAVLGVHVDGGLGEWLAIDPRFLHPMPDVSIDALALVEPLSIGCHAAARASLTPGEEALVIGAGPIGMATAQFALLAGARVTVVDVSPARRDRAAALLPAAEVRAAPPDGRVDVVFDATGLAASMMRSFDYVAAGGRLVYVGLTLDPITISDPEFHRREITLLASRNATPGDFDRVIAAIRSGRVQPLAWITHRVALADLPARFDAIRRDPAVLKALVQVG
jgi:2-desacetyl-2-hydroxyethyl bacteriochlorophyllide A dehydrogenase